MKERMIIKDTWRVFKITNTSLRTINRKWVSKFISLAQVGVDTQQTWNKESKIRLKKSRFEVVDCSTEENKADRVCQGVTGFPTFKNANYEVRHTWSTDIQTIVKKCTVDQPWWWSIWFRRLHEQVWFLDFLSDVLHQETTMVSIAHHLPFFTMHTARIAINWSIFTPRPLFCCMDTLLRCCKIRKSFLP